MFNKKTRTKLGAAAIVAIVALGVANAPSAFAYGSKSGSKNCGTSYMSLTTNDTGAWAEHRHGTINGASKAAWSGPGTHRSGWGTGVQAWFAHAGGDVTSASTICIAP